MSEALDATIVVQTLQGTLDSNNHTRLSAENHIKNLALHPKFALTLALILVQPSHLHYAVRQVSGVLLRRFIQEHYESVPDEDKTVLRANLPHGLTDSSSKVATTVSMCIAEMAQYDYPERWPELIQTLIDLFERSTNQQSHSSAYNALRCLSYTSEHFSDNQVTQVFPTMVPYMLRVATGSYSDNIRIRALVIIHEMLGLLGMLSGEFAEGTDQLLSTVLDGVVSIVRTYLGSTQHVNGLKMQSLKILSALVKYFPKRITSVLPPLLGTLLTTMLDSYPIYYKNVAVGYESDEYDEEGESVGLSTIVCQMMELIATIAEGKHFRHILTQDANNLQKLLYLIISYCQLTTAQLDAFEDEPNRFIADEDDYTMTDNVRAAAITLICTLVDKGHAIQPLVAAVNNHITESKGLQQNNDPSWWRKREAALLALSALYEQLLSDPSPIPTKQLLHAIISEDLNQSTPPPLQLRALQLVGHLCSELEPVLLERYAQYLIYALGSKSLSLRLGACRGVGLLVNERADVVGRYCSDFARGVCSASMQSNDDTAHIVLESLSVIIRNHANEVYPIGADVINLLLHMSERFCTDPAIPMDILDVFDKLGASDRTYPLLLTNLLPPVRTLLTSTLTPERMSLIELTLQYITLLLRHSKTREHRMAVAGVLESVLRLLNDNDDAELCQNGIECLRAFVWSCGDDLAGDPLGGIMNLVCQKFLRTHEPMEEGAVLGVGDLVCLIFDKCGKSLGQDTIHRLLALSAERLASATKLPLLQNLIFLFAKLFLSHFDATMDFLINGNALHMVLQRWSDNQQSFFGQYRLKVTCCALLKLLSTGHPALQQYKVTIESVNINEGRRTRSKGPPPRVEIPFALRAFVLVIDGYNRAADAKVSGNGDMHALLYGYHSDGDSDGSDDNFDTFEDDEEEDDIDDPFVVDDPINQVDLLKVTPPAVKELCLKYGQQLLMSARPYMSPDQQLTVQEMLTGKSQQQKKRNK